MLDGFFKSSIKKGILEPNFNKEKDPPIRRTVGSLMQVLRTVIGNVLGFP